MKSEVENSIPTFDPDEWTRKRLRRKGFDPDCEEDLIRILDGAASLDYVHDAAIFLRECGTVRSIPSLKKAVFYPKMDVKRTAMLTLAQIAKESEAEFYLATLTNPANKEKWASMVALSQYGSVRAVKPVAKRLKTILSKSRGRIAGSNTEVVYGAQFLARYAATSQHAIDGLELVKGYWDKLLPEERRKLRETVPAFAGQ